MYLSFFVEASINAERNKVLFWSLICCCLFQFSEKKLLLNFNFSGGIFFYVCEVPGEKFHDALNIAMGQGQWLTAIYINPQLNLSLSFI